MTDILRPVLELSVIIPGILLAYLPVKSYLKQTPFKLTAWLPLSHQMGPVSSAARYYAYLS